MWNLCLMWTHMYLSAHGSRFDYFKNKKKQEWEDKHQTHRRIIIWIQQHSLLLFFSRRHCLLLLLSDEKRANDSGIDTILFNEYCLKFSFDFIVCFCSLCTSLLLLFFFQFLSLVHPPLETLLHGCILLSILISG